MPNFNLVDQPWITVQWSKESQPIQSLGLAETLTRASEIREIVDSSPIVVAGLHRLLLALIHRVFGPASPTTWADIWNRGGLDQAALEDYLAKWHARFDLFDDRQPFYQVASLDQSYAAPIARLAHELTANVGNALFNHSVADAVEMSPAKAARFLVAHQAFAVSGLITYEKGQDPLKFKSADAAPLTKGAVVTVKGSNLFETLLLNLHWYSPKNEQPFHFMGEDQPCWERDTPTRGEDRWPDGYIDLLTWQSRRIHLFPVTNAAGEVQVPRVAIMKGNQFPDGYMRRDHETMLVFRAVKDAKPGQDPWPAIAFQDGRALWRDSLALFQSAGAETVRPRLLNWLSYLANEGIITREPRAVDIAGLAVDRAKVFFWRHERLPLPLVYLSDKELLAALRNGLSLAEEVGLALRGSLWILAMRLLAPDSDHENARKPLKGDIEQIVDNLAAERVYWSQLDAAFRQLLVDLPTDVDAAGDYGATQLVQWAATLRQTARAAFRTVERSLDGSGRTLKAVAQAARGLERRLNDVLEEYQPDERARGGVQ